MAEEISSIEELKRAQAAAQQQGTSITNYSRLGIHIRRF